jgi:hypothetical protein
MSTSGGKTAAAEGEQAPADSAGPDPVGLSFIDLLYAVPIADLATRISATHLHHITATGWLDLAVVFLAITFGWIGHHSNRRLMPDSMQAARQASQTPFFEARFVQFLVEVLIIVAYFALGQRVKLPEGAGVGEGSELWKAEWLLGIYFLYLVWDGLDICITVKLRDEIKNKPDPEADEAKKAKEHDVASLEAWEKRAKSGGKVTLAFAILFAISLAAAYGRWLGSIVAFDIIAMVALYTYRVVQQCAHR